MKNFAELVAEQVAADREWEAEVVRRYPKEARAIRSKVESTIHLSKASSPEQRQVELMNAVRQVAMIHRLVEDLGLLDD